MSVVLCNLSPQSHGTAHSHYRIQFNVSPRAQEPPPQVNEAANAVGVVRRLLAGGDPQHGQHAVPCGLGEGGRGGGRAVSFQGAPPPTAPFQSSVTSNKCRAPAIWHVICVVGVFMCCAFALLCSGNPSHLYLWAKPFQHFSPTFSGGHCSMVTTCNSARMALRMGSSASFTRFSAHEMGPAPPGPTQKASARGQRLVGVGVLITCPRWGRPKKNSRCHGLANGR